MRFHPKITFEQYRDTCQAVVTAKTKSVRKQSWKWYVGVGLFSLTLGIFLQLPVARVPALIIFTLLILCWVFSKPLAKRSQENCFKAIFSEEQEALNNQILTVDESGISCARDDGQVTSHHTWEAFMGRIDMPDAYVFLPSPNSFIRVPKDMLTLSELELVWHWSSMLPTADTR